VAVLPVNYDILRVSLFPATKVLLREVEGFRLVFLTGQGSNMIVHLPLYGDSWIYVLQRLTRVYFSHCLHVLRGRSLVQNIEARMIGSSCTDHATCSCQFQVRGKGALHGFAFLGSEQKEPVLEKMLAAIRALLVWSKQRMPVIEENKIDCRQVHVVDRGDVYIFSVPVRAGLSFLQDRCREVIGRTGPLWYGSIEVVDEVVSLLRQNDELVLGYPSFSLALSASGTNGPGIRCLILRLGGKQMKVYLTPQATMSTLRSEVKRLFGPGSKLFFEGKALLVHTKHAQQYVSFLDGVILDVIVS